MSWLNKDKLSKQEKEELEIAVRLEALKERFTMPSYLVNEVSTSVARLKQLENVKKNVKGKTYLQDDYFNQHGLNIKSIFGIKRPDWIKFYEDGGIEGVINFHNPKQGGIYELEYLNEETEYECKLWVPKNSAIITYNEPVFKEKEQPRRFVGFPM